MSTGNNNSNVIKRSKHINGFQSGHYIMFPVYLATIFLRNSYFVVVVSATLGFHTEKKESVKQNKQYFRSICVI